MLFCPFSVFEIKAASPMCYKIREEETIASFINRLRKAQSETGNVCTSQVSAGDKIDLLKRYLLEETQADLGMDKVATRNQVRGVAGQGQNGRGRANGAQNSSSSPISNRTLSDTQIFNQFNIIFGKLLTQEEIVSAYKMTGNNYDKTIEVLLKMAKKKELLDKERKEKERQEKLEREERDSQDLNEGSTQDEDSPRKEIVWDENPVKAGMCLEERKLALYNYAKARYIHKFGSIKSED